MLMKYICNEGKEFCIVLVVIFTINCKSFDNMPLFGVMNILVVPGIRSEKLDQSDTSKWLKQESFQKKQIFLLYRCSGSIFIRIRDVIHTFLHA